MLPTGDCITSLRHGETYKYLGVLENCGIHHNQIRHNISCEYKRRLQLILSSELFGRNKLQAINALALPIIRYTAGIAHWPINALEELDRQTRKLLTIHRGLHPRSDVDRLYLPRQKGGMGLCSVLDVVREEEYAAYFIM